MSKKKAPPVVLLSVIGVLVVLSVVVNASGFLQNPAAFFQKRPEPPKQDTPAPTSESTAAATDSAKKELASAMSSGPASRRRGGPEGPESMEGLVNGVPKDPVILIVEQKQQRPVANDSNISGQWYRDESRQAKRAREMAAKRAAASGS